MHSYLLYRPAPHRDIVIFFAMAVALHGAAVAIASRHREELRTLSAIVEPPGIDLQDPDAEAPPPPEDEETDPTPLPPPDDARDFVEPTPPPALPHKSVTSPQRLVRPPTSRPGATNFARGGKALAISAPRPEYPYEARRQRLTGTGVALLSVDPTSGNVISVSMIRSTGRAVSR